MIIMRFIQELEQEIKRYVRHETTAHSVVDTPERTMAWLNHTQELEEPREIEQEK